MTDSHPLISSLPEGDFRSILAHARWDMRSFCRDLLGFMPNPGQDRLFNAYLMRDETRWRPAYLTICTTAGNRAGKTLGQAAIDIHSALFKMNRRPPDPFNDRLIELWMREPYDFYHFGLQQETAELVWLEIDRLLKGVHEAQKGRGCPLVEQYLGPEVAETTRKERGEYVWVVLNPNLGGGQIHFRTTSEKAIGSLGKDIDGESYDEAAFDPNFDFIVDEVLHFRRMSTGGQLFLIGTPTEGLTAFADKWEDGNPDNPGRKRRSMSVRISTRENIGFGIDQPMFDAMVNDLDEKLVAQNIDGFFIEGRSAFFGADSVDRAFVQPYHDERCDQWGKEQDGDAKPCVHLPEEALPERNHRYVNGVDPALTFDSTFAVVLDRTNPEKVRGVRIRRKTGRQSITSVASMIIEGHRVYNSEGASCGTACDVTGFGGKAFRDVLTGIHPFRGVEFGGTRSKKLRLLNNLKAAFEKRKLLLPRVGIWLALRRQLLGYRLNDRGQGMETDAVMALAVAWDEVERNKGGVNASEDFGFFGTLDRVSSVRRGVPTIVAGRRVTVLSREGSTGGTGTA